MTRFWSPWSCMRKAARRGTAAVLLAGGILPALGQADARAVEAVLIDTFTNPVHVAVAPRHPRLLFVVERAGQIRVLRDQTPLGTPFLDIRHFVRGLPDTGAGGEEGLLSVAFPPDYAESRRFYVFFTNNDGNIEIDEFQRSASNPVEADPDTRRVVMTIPHIGAHNHNGGQLQFDSNGLLYASTGDGGDRNNARSLGNLLGKILRINPLPAGTRTYGIPADNPFVGKTGRDEIFSYGLRNPWRFSLAGENIAIGDVGQGRWEEVNPLPRQRAAGANFGWPQYEGELLFDNTRPGPHPPTFPIFTYSQDGGGCSVVGGYIVRDPDLPDLTGRYLYGDFCTGEVRSFQPRITTQEALDDRPTGAVLPQLTSFGRGFGGQIYATGLGGGLYRLDP